ncbi:hypothetical protein QP027_07995 [Corynebacterium breve]|uniref:Alpha helical Porin B n=1 Tax=Corynebacterium breve TaxID=3049799 RepID=A0ABY8VBL4_9CORY|nr:hypothetical protein [Corynebacterium breve]WIM67065.1 hypothetical protein QP027_07995 [Corynebacterium breve]
MSRFTRLGATIAAAALTFGLATPAQAQDANVFDLLKTINAGVENTDCSTLGTVLRGAKLVDDTTTRSQLVADLNSKLGDDATMKLVSGPTINKLGDRALECKIVKADKLTPADQALQFASKLSAEAGLPELRNVAPLLSSNL